MLDQKKLDQVKTVIVHDNCADGTVSAMLLKDALNGNVRVRFVQYGTDAHKNLTPEPGMLFCDFSPIPESAQNFIDSGAMILDHHKTAQPIVEAFGENGVFGNESTEPGVCGAVLAYRHVWQPRREQYALDAEFWKNFAELAGVRDTWQRNDPRWKKACIQANILHFFPTDNWMNRLLDGIAEDWQQDFEPIGEVLWNKREKSVQRLCRDGLRFTTSKGTHVMAFNGITETSDVAEAIGPDADLVVGFMTVCEAGTPKYILSTRSHTNFDCSEFSKSNGGGGHSKAAGFNFTINIDTTPNPYLLLRTLVEEFES